MLRIAAARAACKLAVAVECRGSSRFRSRFFKQRLRLLRALASRFSIAGGVSGGCAAEPQFETAATNGALDPRRLSVHCAQPVRTSLVKLRAGVEPADALDCVPGSRRAVRRGMAALLLPGLCGRSDWSPALSVCSSRQQGGRQTSRRRFFCGMAVRRSPSAGCSRHQSQASQSQPCTPCAPCVTMCTVLFHNSLSYASLIRLTSVHFARWNHPQATQGV